VTVSIAVIGATGLVGEQLLATLAGAGLPVGRLAAWAGPNRSARVDSVSFGEESVGVSPSSALDELEVEVAFRCVPHGLAPRIAAGIRGRASLVIDVGGAVGALFHPALSAGPAASEEGRVRLPSTPALVLGPALAALVSRGLVGVDATVALSAGSAGRAGVDELGQQCIARLNGQDPPRRVFPTGLAFDALPEDALEGEPSAREAQAVEELALLSGLPAGEVGVQITTFPLFAGLTVGLALRGVDVDAVEASWADVAGLYAVRRVERLRPRSTVGKAVVGWGRLQPSPGGARAWLVADPVVLAASAAVETLRLHLEQA
jgi:aspartate-semialdehyde dehydrogenase